MVALLLTAAATAEAQVEVRCRLTHASTLQFEPVRAVVTVNNQAGKALLFGSAGNATLRFLVERKPGYPVGRLSEDDVAAGWLVPAWQTRRIEVPVSKFHDIRRTGPYSLRARINTGGQHASSAKMLLDVVPGLLLKELRVAGAGDGDNRLYSLRVLTRDRGDELFLRIEDPVEQVCYAVHGLGRSIARRFPPQLRGDAQGRIHVLHQSSPTRVTHTWATADGRSVEQAFHASVGAPAQLVRGANGGITVRGGAETMDDTEVPRPAIRPFDPFSMAP